MKLIPMKVIHVRTERRGSCRAGAHTNIMKALLIDSSVAQFMSSRIWVTDNNKEGLKNLVVVYYNHLLQQETIN